MAKAGRAMVKMTPWKASAGKPVTTSIRLPVDQVPAPVKVGQITTGITSAPQYLILNNTQGSYGGPTNVPVTMLVDYVRVWQH
jgi:hypothetical protein